MIQNDQPSLQNLLHKTAQDVSMPDTQNGVRICMRCLQCQEDLEKLKEVEESHCREQVTED